MPSDAKSRFAFDWHIRVSRVVAAVSDVNIDDTQSANDMCDDEDNNLSNVHGMFLNYRSIVIDVILRGLTTPSFISGSPSLKTAVGAELRQPLYLSISSYHSYPPPLPPKLS